MNFDIDLLGKNVVKNFFSDCGFELRDLPAICIADYRAVKPVEAVSFIVARTQNALNIGIENAPCYYLPTSIVNSINSSGEYSDQYIICFPDFGFGKVFYEKLPKLIKTTNINGRNFPVKITDEPPRIYFHRNQFGQSFHIKDADAKKFAELYEKNFSQSVDPNIAVETVIRLHKQKSDKLHAEFALTLRGLLD